MNNTTTDKYEFSEKGHRHSLNGVPLMGCTTVLSIISKPALIPWAAGEVVKYIQENCDVDQVDSDPVTYLVKESDLAKAKNAHRKKKETAADWGKIVHKAIEMWVQHGAGEIPPPLNVTLGEKTYRLTDDQMVAVNHFVKWARDNQVKFLYSEKGLYSKEWWVGGIADIICEINGKIYIGDIKTGSGIYEEFFLQMSAYAKMAIEMGLIQKVDGVIVLNCKKDGTFEKEERFQIDANIKCFEAALTLYKRLKID